MAQIHIRDRWRSTALAGMCLYLCACISVRGTDFAAKYGSCPATSNKRPFAAGVVQDGPAAQAARANFVEQVSGQSEALRQCYEEALANVSRLQGRVVLRMSLNAQGAVKELGVIENTTNYDALGCCVAAVVRRSRPPPSTTGASIGLDYPFAFELTRMPLGYNRDMGSDYVNTSVRPEGYALQLDGMMFGDP